MTAFLVLFFLSPTTNCNSAREATQVVSWICSLQQLFDCRLANWQGEAAVVSPVHRLRRCRGEGAVS